MAKADEFILKFETSSFKIFIDDQPISFQINQDGERTKTEEFILNFFKLTFTFSFS